MCNYAIALLALCVAAAVQRWVLSHGVAAAQEWQQTADPEAGIHAQVGPLPAVARPLGPFTAPLYPITCHVSPGSSAHSNDSTASASSGGEAASARDTAASQDGTAASRHQGWWQLRMPKNSARAAAEDEPAV